jgi:PKD repeat protein
LHSRDLVLYMSNMMNKTRKVSTAFIALLMIASILGILGGVPKVEAAGHFIEDPTGDTTSMAVSDTDITYVDVTTDESNMIFTIGIAGYTIPSPATPIGMLEQEPILYEIYIDNHNFETNYYLGAMPEIWDNTASATSAGTVEYDTADNTVIMSIPLSEISSEWDDGSAEIYVATQFGCGEIGFGIGVEMDIWEDRAPDSGTVSYPPPIKIVVDSDSLSPTCAIVSPIAGTIVSGTVQIAGTASPGAGTSLTNVQVKIDGDGTWTNATNTGTAFSTWSYLWDTTAVKDGTHTIFARACNASGNSTETIVSVKVSNCGSAAFTAEAGGPYAGNAGSAVSFIGSASGGTYPYRYKWNFGDGGAGAGASATHTYAKTGTYTVALTVIDNENPSHTVTDTATVRINIASSSASGQQQASNVAPVCSLDASPSSGKAPLEVSFAINTSDSDDSIALWSLDVNGDGSAEYSGQNDPPATIIHTYYQAGTYNAKLTVADHHESKAECTKMIVVNAPPQTQQQAENRAPDKPSSPFPTSRAISVDTHVLLSWSCYDLDGDALRYVLYFGTNRSNLNLASSIIKKQSHEMENLTNSTTYYWKIVVVDEHGALTNGSIWSFTTAYEEKQASITSNSLTRQLPGFDALILACAIGLASIVCTQARKRK